VRNPPTTIRMSARLPVEPSPNGMKSGLPPRPAQTWRLVRLPSAAPRATPAPSATAFDGMTHVAREIATNTTIALWPTPYGERCETLKSSVCGPTATATTFEARSTASTANAAATMSRTRRGYAANSSVSKRSTATG
jgi:hypothetical protein